MTLKEELLSKASYSKFTMSILFTTNDLKLKAIKFTPQQVVKALLNHLEPWLSNAVDSNKLEKQNDNS